MTTWSDCSTRSSSTRCPSRRGCSNCSRSGAGQDGPDSNAPTPRRTERPRQAERLPAWPRPAASRRRHLTVRTVLSAKASAETFASADIAAAIRSSVRESGSGSLDCGQPRDLVITRVAKIDYTYARAAEYAVQNDRYRGVTRRRQRTRDRRLSRSAARSRERVDRRMRARWTLHGSGDAFECAVEPLIAAAEPLGHAGCDPAVAHLSIDVAHCQHHRGAAVAPLAQHEGVDTRAGKIVELLGGDDPVWPIDLVVGAADTHHARAVWLGEHPAVASADAHVHLAGGQREARVAEPAPEMFRLCQSTPDLVGWCVEITAHDDRGVVWSGHVEGVCPDPHA